VTTDQIDLIVRTVPGGAANVQDIYPLTPLQEGFLFHHLLEARGDPYLLAVPYVFPSRARLDAYVTALQAVIARHDILRTAVLWEGLPEPVQVVWRHAPLPIEELACGAAPAAGDVAQQLFARCNPREHRIDIRQAPLLRAHVAYDAAHDQWLMMQLLHHLATDHMTLDVLQTEIQAHLAGAEAVRRLPPPQPFRNLVAQARLGGSRAADETYFRALLGDVDAPTAPFGLVDVQGDGTGMTDARLQVDRQLSDRLRVRARILAVSVATLCHVAWAQVLARVSGRPDVVFGTVLLGRMQGGNGADRVLGPFINTLPVRITVGATGAAPSTGGTASTRTRVPGVGAALQRRAGTGATLLGDLQLPSQCSPHSAAALGHAGSRPGRAAGVVRGRARQLSLAALGR
jgi:hypothetical protein